MLRPQGGVRGQKNYFLIFFSSSWIWQHAKKPHQKINFLADAILFWKSNFACNYSRHPNFKRKYLKIMFNDLYIDNHLLIFSITLSEWSVGLSEKKLCSDFDYFDVSRFYGLFLSAKLLKNMKNCHFWEFFGHKNIKK